MRRTPSESIVKAIRHAAVTPALAQLSDEALLRRFREQREEAAFEVIVQRHGATVLEVGRTVAPGEADDVFQATFLLLARGPANIRKGASLGSWLHGVAYRMALKARAAVSRRRKHESRVPARECSEPDQLTWREVRQVVHEELNLLPESLRAVLVVCYLQGKTQDEAAKLLQLARGTLKGRLERARERLRVRLTRRGLGLGALLPVACWPAFVSAERVPSALVASALAAVDSTGGGTVAVSPFVQYLIRGGTQAMLAGKLKLAMLSVAFISLVGGLAAFALPGGGEPAGAAEKATAASASDEDKGEETAPADDEAWKKAFVAAYGLKQGELLKRIAPPYPPCRESYLRDRFQAPAGQIANYDQYFTVFTWKGNWAPAELARHTLPVKPDRGISVIQLLDRATGIPANRIEGAALLDGKSATGDYVVRDGATPEQLIPPLQDILQKECGLQVSFRFKETEAEVLVLSGKYTSKPLKDRDKDEIELYSMELTDRKTGGGGSGTFDELLQHVERHVGKRVALDRVTNLPRRVSWHYNVRSPMLKDPARGIDTFAEDTDANTVVTNLAAQTGLRMTSERRKVRVLMVEPMKGNRP